MPLNANLTMIFIDYLVNDDGVVLHFLCPNPGAAQESDYYVLLTDAEIASVSTTPQLATLVKSKLQRKLRATGMATKLDALIGQSLVNI